MNVFETHARIVNDYARYIRSFINIADSAIRETVAAALAEGKLWPQPLLQFNPAYELGNSCGNFVRSRLRRSALTSTVTGNVPFTFRS